MVIEQGKIKIKNKTKYFGVNQGLLIEPGYIANNENLKFRIFLVVFGSN